MRSPPRMTLCLAAALAGCTTFPELDAVVSEEAKRADYLSLVPADQLLGKRSDGRVTEETGRALQARAADLRARAALLRGQPIDEETRLRLRARLRRLGG